jgi:hydroxymethylglutaryl-CoA reductase
VPSSRTASRPSGPAGAKRPAGRNGASSRLSGFHRRALEERRAEAARFAELSEEEVVALAQPLSLEIADRMVENVVGQLSLPLAVATNFLVNGQDVLVPMAIEEPSVVAAASGAARAVREGGGFLAESDPPRMIAQVEVREVSHPDRAKAALAAAKEEILAAANAVHPRLQERGGGAVDLEVRELAADPAGGRQRLSVHLVLDCRDAMGANLCNTVAEALAPRIAEIAGGTRGLAILSNLADRRRVTVCARIPVMALGTERFAGEETARAIVQAAAFAELDPYRAATHNKGIMNGVDAVALACGQDWRALEAGAHAYAARGGGYAPLSRWWIEGETLAGEMTLPMAVGTVGGALRAHPGMRVALRLTRARSATELGQVIASAGMATNLAALRALATEGIQRGHMALHRRLLA